MSKRPSSDHQSTSNRLNSTAHHPVLWPNYSTLTIDPLLNRTFTLLYIYIYSQQRVTHSRENTHVARLVVAHGNVPCLAVKSGCIAHCIYIFWCHGIVRSILIRFSGGIKICVWFSVVSHGQFLVTH